MTARPRRSLRHAGLGIPVVAGSLLLSGMAYGDDPPAARALPPDVQADVAAIAGHLAQVSDTASPLSCDKAVENARWGVETMLEVGEKNLRAGYMSPSAYDAATPALKRLLAALTTEDCAAATGARRDFYQCMSSDYNHVYACGKAHPFDP
ncbi:hypothetical protein [Pseudoxanthomonas sp. SE1]|uniref:hypothetical protein n=1 Tax=Pseudoxanthomonas sp. SE1 TaxID=1664560 RepID=UPI00240E3E72|nr:hypothetical protein [Pseudoxanthomonas sp. SE1]WFC41439.1 hypothetical protein OY559_16880 [Pseudoxanthomonas sp. SE1]